jgi:hypothetical protein
MTRHHQPAPTHAGPSITLEINACVDDKTIRSLPALGSDLIVLLRNFPFSGYFME